MRFAHKTHFTRAIIYIYIHIYTYTSGILSLPSTQHARVRKSTCRARSHANDKHYKYVVCLSNIRKKPPPLPTQLKPTNQPFSRLWALGGEYDTNTHTHTLDKCLALLLPRRLGGASACAYTQKVSSIGDFRESAPARLSDRVVTLLLWTTTAAAAAAVQCYASSEPADACAKSSKSGQNNIVP